MTSHKRKKKEAKISAKLQEQKRRACVRANVFDLCSRKPILRTYEDAIILASGINGVEAYDKINESDLVIAVNDAVIIPEFHHRDNIKIDVWFVQDPRTCERPYFKKADESFQGIRVFNLTAAALS